MRGGGITVIQENESGVYINDELIEGTDVPLAIPSFEGYRYPAIMKTLYHEIMFNIIDGAPYARLKDSKCNESGAAEQIVFYRDAAMVGLFLESINRVDAIASWISSIDSMYDFNRGIAEPDNLGQVLYLQSLLPASERNQSLIRDILQEARRICDADGNLSGTTDGARTAAYQNGWLIFGLKKLGMNEEALDFNHESSIDDNGYKSLLWFTLPESGCSLASFEDAIAADSTNGWTEVDGDLYPYLSVARSHYALRSGGRVEPPVLSSMTYPISWGDRTRPHIWHAVELYLYFCDLEECIR